MTTTATRSTPAGADRSRTLRTPFTSAAWRVYLYFLLVSGLAVVGVVYLFATGLTSGLLSITLIGIPLLALVVLSGRWWNALYRALARHVGVTIDPPAPFRRRASWPNTLAAALTDAVGWRSLGFLLLQSIVMTPLGYGVVIGVVISVVLVVSPVLWTVGIATVSLGERRPRCAAWSGICTTERRPG